ncbi:MAG: cell division protein FtsL [Terracidiphilus sp.]|nr:cell division protein FtsL [Terracidiphilus sp.]
MAAYTATYPQPGRNWSARVSEHNAAIMAQQALRRSRVRTPEFFLTKNFDNSRLVKAPDPAKLREMRIFSAAIAVLFSLVMIYGLQHFYAIESGYHVEQEKLRVNELREENRQLRLTQAELTQPGRIDNMARQYGLAAPLPGQVVHGDARPDGSAPVVAQMNAPAAPPAQ